MADTNIDFSTKYSLSSLINNLLRINQNGLEIMNKLSDITTTDSDVVEIDVLDANNQISKVFVPSYGQIKAEINRLDNNIKQLSGIGDSNANVQLQDGSFRKLILSNLQLEGNTVTALNAPTTFESRSNWFFESFLNPLLYVSFNLTDQIPADTERCKMQRFMLNLDTTNKLNVWNNQINGKSNLDYVKFFQLLLNNNITYFLDEDTIDLPAREIRFYGSFKVQRVFDDIIESEVDGVTFQKRRFRFQLDTLNYNDALSEYTKTQQLKLGDSIVIVGKGTSNNTKFEIINIDEDSGNIIEVKLIEGFDTIAIGSTLSYYNDDSTDTTIDVNIGFNEHNVIFLKPINPISKIPALEWSPGVAFYTNDMQIIDEAGNQLTLEEYYKEQVVDFGAILYNMAKDGIPPATMAETPYVPNVAASDFVVSQINNHITDVARIDKIKKLQSERLSIQSELDSLNESIKKKRADINTKRYTSQAARDTDLTELNDLINRSSSSSTLLKSAVDEIIALAESDNLEGITPKYRVKGFWPVPDPKVSGKTAPQEVVQFKVRYRYVTKDGGGNQPEQIEFTDNSGVTRRGTFSTWEEFTTPVRKRKKNAQGNYYWVADDVENADEVNSNQLEIAIKQGEGVEIQIKSISEAGWPVNPAESDWTDTVRVEFPDELVSTNEISTIVEQAKLASESLELQVTLAESGVTEHVSQQFTQNETFYAHPSTMIASGFLTDEQNVINLFEKLTDFETRLRLIEEAITGEKGLLAVAIVDDGGNETIVKKDTLVRLFAGNYKDQVSDLQVSKGAIVSKTYSLRLSNVNASTLELYSRQFGSFLNVVDASFVGGTGYDANDNDYNTSRRYDLVPLGPQNPNTDLVASNFQFQELPFQTGQVKGQYINVRYRDIQGTTALYENVDAAGDPLAFAPADAINGFPAPGTPLTSYAEHEYTLSTQYPMVATNVVGDFIWSGTFTGSVPDTVGATNLSNNPTDGIFVHKDHPDLNAWGTVAPGPVIGPTGVGAAGPTGVRNSVFAPMQSTDITSGSLKQSVYHYFDSIVGATESGKVSKMAFDAYDQYLLGRNSCGAYLFLSPSNNTGAINVDGTNQLSIKNLEFGSKNSINIPVIFQYRMTDYFGDGNVGLGNIGGDETNTTTQLEYTKKIGIDIYSNQSERFSFDLQVTARYRSRSLQLQDVPSQSLTNVVDDLTRTVRILNPRLSGVSSESQTRANQGNNSLLGDL